MISSAEVDCFKVADKIQIETNGLFGWAVFTPLT